MTIHEPSQSIAKDIEGRGALELALLRESERILHQRLITAEERLRVAEGTVEILRDKCCQLEKVIGALRSKVGGEEF